MGNQELIIKYIRRYICDDVGLNSAILIKGVWGCGKTYFIKKTLSPSLNDLLREKDKHLCYISLNGVSNIKEFMKRIQSVVIRTNSIFGGDELNSNDIDIITGFDSILDDINLQSWVKIVWGAKNKIKSRIFKKSINATVFVFDDLERCTIPLKEILGAINDLVEHKGCKCIIVANEDEIDGQEDFKKIKEKFISRTIEFFPDVNAFFKVQKKNYEKQPLGMLKDKIRNEFISAKNFSGGINLRIIQSALFTANEIIKICYEKLYNENNNIVEYVLKKILNDTYNVEEFYKKGNMCPDNIKYNEVLGLYDLGCTDYLTSRFEIFNFVFKAVYDGEYDENIILNHIGIYIQSIKTKENLSPVAELKHYYLLEDEDIQEKLNQINSNIKEMSLAQACDFLNFLIPLLDLGFEYSGFTNFNRALEHILNEINFYELKNSILFEVVENHTILKGPQRMSFILAINKIKGKIRKKSIINSHSFNNLLTGDNWLEKLQADIRENENKYRQEKKYLSLFDQDILMTILEQCSNKQLFEFRNLLYGLYRRDDCTETFDNDIESAHKLIEKLKAINISRKINKATINYIIGDLNVSFPKNVKSTMKDIQ